MSLVAITQGTVRNSAYVGHVGTPVEAADPMDIYTGINVMDQAKDTWTILRTGANATYTFVYTDPHGTSYTYSETVTGSTTADDTSDMAAILGQKAELTAYFDVTSSSSTITLTGKYKGITATFSGSTNVTITNTVAGNEGTDIPVGRLVLSTGYSTDPGAKNRHRLVLGSDRANGSTALTAQVVTDTFSGTIGAGDEVQTRYYVPALDLYTDWVKSEYDTSEAVTLAAHVVLLDAELGTVYGAGYGIEAAVSGSTITHTADIAGYAFQVETIVTNTASGTWAVAQANTTGAVGDPATDISQHLAGIVVRGPGAQPSADTVDDAVYQPGRAVPFAKKGQWRVANSDGVTHGQQVWVSVTAATDGRLYNSGSSTRLPVAKSKLRWERDAGSGVAHLAVNL